MIKIKYIKKVRDILVLPTLVDPVCTHSPDIILPTFSCFEKISRSQEPPGLGDIDLLGSWDLLGLRLEAADMALIMLRNGHNCALSPFPCAH